jgi:uncharacterized protein involved in propanediol utilization
MTLLIANFDPTDGTVFDSATVFFHLAKLVQGDSEIGMHPDPLDASVSLSPAGVCKQSARGNYHRGEDDDLST